MTAPADLLPGAEWLPVLAELAAKATLVLLLAAAAAALLWRSSAAARHLVWCLGVAGVLVLPLLAALAPAWELPLLPAEPASAFEAREAPPPARNAQPQSASAGGSEAAPAGRLPALAAGVAAAGTGAGLLWLAAGLWGVARLGRRAEVVRDPEWLRAAQDAAGRLGLRRPVLLLRSPGAVMPATWGLLWPSVILPSGADGWPDDRRRAVLAHELAHVKRFDCLTQALAQVACALFWWHPAVWYAARRLRVERERACDDLVLGAGARASDYAAHLLEIARTHRGPRLAAAALVSMAKPSQLESRLLSVLDEARARGAPSARALLLSGIAGLLVVGPLAAVRPTRAAAAAPLPRPAAALPSPADTLPAGDPLEALVAMRSVGVDSAYVAELRAAGYRGLTPAQLVGLKSVGVTGRYAGEMNAAGYGRLTPAQLADLKAVGVTAAYVEELRRHGYAGLSLDQIRMLQSVAVDGAYIEEMNGAGLGRLTPEQLRELKAVGTTAAHVRELAAAGLGPFTPEQLVRRRQ